MLSELQQDAPDASARRPPIRLSRFATSLRDLASGQDVDETLQLAVDLAAELIPGCDYADIMFIRQGGTTTPVSSHPIAVALDELQEKSNEGPCRSTMETRQAVVADDLGADERWPTFGPQAVEMGVRSAACYQLFLHRNDGDRLGALNLFGAGRGVFDEWATELGEVFAAHCAAVLAAAIAQEGARAALQTRDVIGQAKGILMARHKLSAVEAFDLLRRSSQSQHMKVRDLAALVAETGSLPD
jgi:GAF domain-containing protein